MQKFLIFHKLNFNLISFKEILDTYSGSWAVLLLGALECISVSWFYGFGNLKKDISIMLGDKKYTDYKIFYVWNAFWFAITPTFLFVIF